jgi:hypothetical protein
MTSPILRQIANNQKYYFDLLESGEFMVSDKDKSIKIYSNDSSKDAIFLYLGLTSEKLEDMPNEEGTKLLEWVLAKSNESKQGIN